jgi:hypothetical protein
MLSSPTDPSCDRNLSHLRLDPSDDSAPLSPSYERHLLHEMNSHGADDRYRHDTFRCIACDSFQGISVRARNLFHRTNIGKESSSPLQSPIPSSVLAQHGSSDPNDELFRVLSHQLLTPSLEYHAGQREDHIRSQSLCGIRLKCVHNALNLRLNFHNN